jgi:hypothetical protein
METPITANHMGVLTVVVIYRHDIGYYNGPIIMKPLKLCSGMVFNAIEQCL